MKSAFRKVSSIRTVTGGMKWYLSDECLLSAKRVMYSVEYRRFYLRDLESVIVWPSHLWLWRVILPAVLLGIPGFLFWQFVNSTFGYVVGGVALLWVILELALGPTAKSRIRITGATIELPLVMRTRRAPKVLAKIDAAVRATRASAQPLTSAVVEPAVAAVATSPEEARAAASGAATPTNAS